MAFATIKKSEYVQILHDGNHWLTVTNIGCQEPDVHLYDSKYHRCSTQQQIACIMGTRCPSINLHFFNVNRQNGSSDCGLFSIAYAVSLCFGLEPEKFCYDQTEMRGHLIACLEKGKMEPFPVRRQRRIPSTISYHQTIKVFCVCRMPQIQTESMLECSGCKEWFHESCVQIPKEAWEPSTKWLCSKH